MKYILTCKFCSWKRTVMGLAFAVDIAGGHWAACCPNEKQSPIQVNKGLEGVQS